MKNLDILADLISPPTPAVAEAIECGLLALDAEHVDPETATALMQRLCSNAPISPTHVQAGVAIFERLRALGGNPWEQVLPDLPSAAEGAMQQQCSGLVVKSLAHPHPPIEGLMVCDTTGRTSNNKVSWLQFSVDRGMREVVKALLESGMDPNACKAGHTPLLHRAPTHSGIVPLLLEHGADPCVTDPEGRLCVQSWKRDHREEFVDMLSCVVDRGPGLDRFSLLKMAGGRLTQCGPLLQGVPDPRLLTDDQGRSIFFHMAAAALNGRAKGQGTAKKVLDHLKEVLSWRHPQSNQDPLDEGAARLLLWSARALPTETLSQTKITAIKKQEQGCCLAPAGNDGLVPFANALACLDAMAEAGLLHDPSEIASTALEGYWAAHQENSSLSTLDLLDESLDYPAIQWLDRSFRGIAGGPWHHGPHEHNRWLNPDIPIRNFCAAITQALHEAPISHPLWSNPDMGRILIQMLRGEWPSTSKRYYDLDLEILDDSRAKKLRDQYEPLLQKMNPKAMSEASADPVCRAAIMAMDCKNPHIQAVLALMERNNLDNATPIVGRARYSGPRF